MPFDDNKLYCSEVLSILLQSHEGKIVFLCTSWVTHATHLSFIIFSNSWLIFRILSFFDSAVTLLQKHLPNFPPHFKCIVTLPCKIWMFRLCRWWWHGMSKLGWTDLTFVDPDEFNPTFLEPKLFLHCLLCTGRDCWKKTTHSDLSSHIYWISWHCLELTTVEVVANWWHYTLVVLQVEGDDKSLHPSR